MPQLSLGVPRNTSVRASAALANSSIAVSDPNLHSPVDFLISPRYRFVYIIVFGEMASSLVLVFRTINTPSGLNFYAGVVYQTRE